MTMAPSNVLFMAFLLWCFAPLMVSSFAISTVKPNRYILKKKSALLGGVDVDVGGGGQDEPTFFQMQQIPTATTGSRLDHVVDCAENGLCDVDEMFAMIKELELLNSECQDHTSRECSLDAIAARNVLKVAIASRVVLEESTEECVYDIGDDIGDDNPYSSFNEMDDLCNDDMHAIPTAAMRDTDLERIIQCAEEGKCPVGEMAEMIDELEKLNNACSGTISRECSLDAIEARNILKVAIGSQAALARDVKYSKKA